MKEKTKKVLMCAGGIGLGIGTVLLGVKYKKLTSEMDSLKQSISDLREYIECMDHDIFSTIDEIVSDAVKEYIDRDILSVDFVAEAIDAATIARNHDWDMGGK